MLKQAAPFCSSHRRHPPPPPAPTGWLKLFVSLPTGSNWSDWDYGSEGHVDCFFFSPTFWWWSEERRPLWSPGVCPPAAKLMGLSRSCEYDAIKGKWRRVARKRERDREWLEAKECERERERKKCGGRLRKASRHPRITIPFMCNQIWTH